MNRGPSTWKRRRATAATPEPRGGSKALNTQLAAVVVVGLIVVSGILYFGVYSKPNSNYSGERVLIQIAGASCCIANTTTDIPAQYYAANFTVGLGTHVTLVIQNTDNVTHGLAIPHFNLDTGPMKPNATVTLSFVASPSGNYTYYEPSSDCGGGDCNTGPEQAMTGWFVVQS